MHTLGHDDPLTEIEALGLQSRHDLANGHASQGLAPAQRAIIDSLPSLWARASRTPPRQAELEFKEAFRLLARSPALASCETFKVCPTASNSIDAAAAWLASRGLRTALIEPTFDNLALILRRRGVPLIPLPEGALEAPGADAVFLVNPNNPTGRRLARADFEELVSRCARSGQVLVLDNTFRFFAPQDFDQYRILLDSGVTFIALEDTGKVWPTLEIKASLLLCSPDIFPEIDAIYDEIFLCASPFALAVLKGFLNDARERGLEEAVWAGVAERRARLRRALEGTVLGIHPDALGSTISVEWLKLAPGAGSDLELAARLKSRGLVLLPGRQFYWSRTGPRAVSDCVRIALLKPEGEFEDSIRVLETELRRFRNENRHLSVGAL